MILHLIQWECCERFYLLWWYDDSSSNTEERTWWDWADKWVCQPISCLKTQKNWMPKKTKRFMCFPGLNTNYVLSVEKWIVQHLNKWLCAILYCLTDDQSVPGKIYWNTPSPRREHPETWKRKHWKLSLVYEQCELILRFASAWLES